MTDQNKIAAITALVLQGGTLTLQLFLELEPLLNLGPDEKQNIVNACAASDQIDDATIARVNQWLTANPA